MTRSSHTIPFTSDERIEYYDQKGDIRYLPVPPGPGHAIDIKSLLTDLGIIHVWGYGGSAFGLNFEVFIELHPQ